MSLLRAGAFIGLIGCAEHDVDLEVPDAGRVFLRSERSELQAIADATFREVRGRLEGLPPRLTLIVRWGKDVIPETGESGAAGFPGNVGLTLDPDRDVLATIRTYVRPMLVHELHHLARDSRSPSRTFRDRVVSEGLATAFERDITKGDPPWGRAAPELARWTDDVLRQPDGTDPTAWMSAKRDWIGMRVGTSLVDRAARASGQSAATLVFTPTAEILRLADVR